MADKSKAKAEPPPPAKPGEAKKDDKAEANAPKPPVQKSVQPKHEVGTRKGCRRYRWEFKDSNKEFWLLGHAPVKILSLGCLIAAMIVYSSIPVHPMLTLVIVLEICFFCFFIILYSLAIQRYVPFILWPVTDLLNDLIACGFLVAAIVFAVRIRQTLPLYYIIGLVLMGVAAFFALIDTCLQRSHFRGKKTRKNVLVPPPTKGAPAAPTTGQEEAGKGKEAEKGKEAAKGKEAGKGKEPAKGKDKGKDKGKK
ncbi:CKLF-like MARVEL transmembrane domain-containing protein 2 [Carlito syrichta]|uniref:CKLF-like MARVEL transmembrane domain-containing protein 2 n=1 Tax=Carlito syrichta TaxID=1868482 RepID=A0A1U7STJ1_CARSF|nr:CKLF-like MARVEL transmembrane domain-containing protein 2 [Carlito syrichta]